MMRLIALIFVLAQVTINGIAQESIYFEGRVNYTFDVTSKKAGLDPKKIKKILGDGSVLSFKEGNFHHSFTGGILEFDMYIQKENKYYYKRRSNDTIYWYNCESPGDKINKFDFVANKQVILGLKCDKLMIYYNDKTVTHYYNTAALSIDPDWFKNYVLHDQNLIDQREKSIYLKSEIDFPNFLMVETARKIERLKISDTVFEMNPYAIMLEKKIVDKK